MDQAWATTRPVRSESSSQTTDQTMEGSTNCKSGSAWKLGVVSLMLAWPAMICIGPRSLESRPWTIESFFKIFERG